MQADYVHVTITDSQLTLRDQLKEYVDRGELLAGYSFLEYFINTYDTDDSGGKANAECKEGAAAVHATKGLHTKKAVVMITDVGSYAPRDMRLCLTLLGSGFPETMTASLCRIV